MKMRVSRLLFFVLCAALLAGCGSGQDSAADLEVAWATGESIREDEDASEASAKPKYSGDEVRKWFTEEEWTAVKYNVYIEYNNYLVRLMDDLDAYFRTVEDAEEFALRPDRESSFGEKIGVLNPNILDDAILMPGVEPAYDELDRLVLELDRPTRELTGVFNRIAKDAEKLVDRQASGEEFSDREREKLAECHSVIRRYAVQWYEKADAFLEAMDEVAADAVREYEAFLRENGRTVMYYGSRVLTLTDEILKECWRQGVDDGNLEELDVSALMELYEELREAVDAYAAASVDEEQLALEGIDAPQPLGTLPEELCEAVEEMLDQAASGRPVSDPTQRLPGSVGWVRELYGRLTECYNGVFAD